MTDFGNLSIVVPVGPDDSAWRQLLHELEPFGAEPEILLSACRPRPDGLTLPENVNWLCATQGRAQQLNAGAKQAQRDVIWFVHADSRLCRGAADAVLNFIAVGEDSLGYFKLRFAADGPVLTRINARAANWRSRLFGLPFGDQGFIVNKSVFRLLNGFDETVALGEDLDFVVRVKAVGLPLRELSADLITSARRYRQHGWLATTIRHVWLTWALTRQARRRLRTA